MRKALAVLLLLSLLATLVVCAGCGEKGAQEEGTAKQIPIEEDKDAVTPKPGEEKGELPPASTAAPSEKELGVPLYPGAVPLAGSGVVMRYLLGSDQTEFETVRFTTKDAYEDVAAFYTEKLGEPAGTGESDDGEIERSWVPFSPEEQKIYTSIVVVYREDAGARIEIAPRVIEK